MKAVYLVKIDPSVNAEDNWIFMTPRQFKHFKNTPEGQCRKDNFRRLPKCEATDRRVMIEVDKEAAVIMDAERDHVRYIRRMKKESGYEEISFGDYQGEDEILTFEEVIPDENCDVETDALRNLRIDQLRNAISKLAEDEQRFIHELYLSKHPKSEREYATELGTTRTEIQRIKRTIFRTIRNYFEND